MHIEGGGWVHSPSHSTETLRWPTAGASYLCNLLCFLWTQEIRYTEKGCSNILHVACSSKILSTPPRDSHLISALRVMWWPQEIAYGEHDFIWFARLGHKKPWNWCQSVCPNLCSGNSAIMFKGSLGSMVMKLGSLPLTLLSFQPG